MNEGRERNGAPQPPMLLAAGAFAGFPGAALMIDGDGGAVALNVAGEGLAAGVVERWAGIVAQARAALAQTAAWHSDGVVFLPLADGRQVLVLAAAAAVEAMEQRPLHRDRLLRQVVQALRDSLVPDAALAAALAATGLAFAAAGGAVLRRGAAAAPLRLAVDWGAKPAPAVLAKLRTALAQQDEVALAGGGVQMLARAARYRRAVEGAVVLWRRGDDAPFADNERALLAEVADHLGIALAQLEAQDRILALSRTDPLTGLVNRPAFFEEFSRRVARLDRGEKPAVLLDIEVLNLQLVNQRRGPAEEDAALAAFAGVLREHTRAGDLVGRVGDHEFLLWIEGIDLASAERRIAALDRAVGQLAELTGDPAHPLALRVGVAGFDPRRPETPATLIARATAGRTAVAAAG